VQIKFSGSTWRSISEPAKDCIRQMLCPQPEQRPSASELLSHPWLAAVAPQTAIAPHIVHQLQLFAGLSRARRVMLGVAANSISGSEASIMVKHFLAFDRDFNGTLDYQELALATKQVRLHLLVLLLGTLRSRILLDGHTSFSGANPVALRYEGA
jgi:calcium-dependent protein kinase